MKPLLFSRSWRAPILGVLASLCAWDCGDRLAGGTIEIGNSGKVTGRVLTLDGTAAADARVRLIPESYDPVASDSLPSIWSVRTDAAGNYSIDGVVQGGYNIEVRDSTGEKRAIIQSVEENAGGNAELPQPVVKLSEPGRLSVPLENGMAEGYFYLPGTSVYASADSAAQVTGRLTLSGVPVGRYRELIHVVPGISARNLLGRPVAAAAGAELDLGPYYGWKNLLRVTLSESIQRSIPKAGRFPLLIRLNAGNFPFADSKLNGEDLRITLADGVTPLPFEIENWDALNRQAEIWVGAESGAAQGLSLFSGSPAAAAITVPGSVFDTADGYVGVWHLGLSLQDASASGNPGIDSGAQPFAGLIGKSRRFTAPGRHVAVPDRANLRFGIGDFTLSAWILADSLGAIRQVFCKRNAAANYEVQIQSDGTVNAVLNEKNGQDLSLKSATPIRAGAWYHLAFVRQAGKATLYINGALASGPVDAPQSADPGSELRIGDDPALPGQETFRGRIDEVEFARRARSPEWLKFLYETQKPASTAVSLSSAD